jgi:hypothetical protein
MSMAETAQLAVDLTFKSNAGTVLGGVNQQLKTADTSAAKLKSALAAGIGMAGGAMASLALTGGAALDSATTRLVADAGLVGKAADDAGHSIARLYENNLQGFDAIGAAMAKVHNDMGLVGQAADDETQRFLTFQRATGQASDAVTEFDKIQDAWNLTSADTQSLMDKLVVSHQKYGGAIADNEAALHTMAPAMQAANMTIDDGIALLNLFETAGIDASKAPMALQRAVAQLKPGQSLNDLIAQISSIEDPTLRGQAAMKLFGARGGIQLAQAFKPGLTSLADLTASLGDTTGATDKAAEAALSWGDRATLALHNVGGALAEFGTNFGPLLMVAATIGPKVTTVLLSGLGGLGGLIIPKITAAILGATVPAAVAGEAVGLATGTAAGTAVPGAFAAAAALAFPALVGAFVVSAGIILANAIDALFPGLAKRMHDDFFAGLDAVFGGGGFDPFADMGNGFNALGQKIPAVGKTFNNLGYEIKAATVDVKGFADAATAGADTSLAAAASVKGFTAIAVASSPAIKGVSEFADVALVGGHSTSEFADAALRAAQPINAFADASLSAARRSGEFADASLAVRPALFSVGQAALSAQLAFTRSGDASLSAARGGITEFADKTFVANLNATRFADASLAADGAVVKAGRNAQVAAGDITRFADASMFAAAKGPTTILTAAWAAIPEVAKAAGWAALEARDQIEGAFSAAAKTLLKFSPDEFVKLFREGNWGGGFQGIVRAAAQAGTGAMSALAASLVADRQKPLDAMDALTEIMKTSLSRGKEAARVVGQLTSKELADGLNDGRPDVRAQAIATYQELLTRLGSLRDATGSIGKEAMDQLRAGMKNKNPEIAKTAHDAMVVLMTGLADRASQATPAGRAAMAALIQGTKDKDPEIRAAALGAMQVAITALNDARLLAAFAGAGSTAGAGYAAALRAEIQAVTDWVIADIASLPGKYTDAANRDSRIPAPKPSPTPKPSPAPTPKITPKPVPKYTGPALATGGLVTAGTPYIVGEYRPELFIPDVPGRILPSVPTALPPVTVYVTVSPASARQNMQAAVVTNRWGGKRKQ